MVQTEIRGKATTHLIMALRHDATHNCPHDAIAYLDYFKKEANWNIAGICLTGNKRSPVPFMKFDPQTFTVQVDCDPYDPPNIISRQIRTKWGFA